jgi:hypothetical protein
MRRFLVVWLVLSLAATGIFGYLYLQRASGPAVEAPVSLSAPPSRGVGEDRFATRGLGAPGGSQTPPAALQGENLALTISIASSIVSALAAIMQTWLTHRAMRGRNFPPGA